MYKIKNWHEYIRRIAKQYMMMNLDVVNRSLCSMDEKTDTFRYIQDDTRYVSSDHVFNLPFVFLVGGVAGSGKSSFIKMCSSYLSDVYELSTIDPVKDVVKFMSSKEVPVRDIYGQGEPLSEAINLKNESYRTLLSKIKQLWVDFNDGPNNITIYAVQDVAKQYGTSLIFVNVREPAQFDHLTARLESDPYNMIVMSVRVDRNSVTEGMNSSDSSTVNYNYDITIDNRTTIEDLDQATKVFCESFVRTNIQLVEMFKDYLELQ